ncbi:MAG: hypothetical protein ACREI3_12985 [Nitrospirales bacterium]
MPNKRKGRATAKKAVKRPRGKEAGGRPRRRASRIAKENLLVRIKQDTTAINAGSILKSLRKLGYDEVPLDEIQDRLSKIRDPLAGLVIARRG